MAGKTGTPQNWSDAWTIGYSPYYTTAIWFGFDKPGNSLGLTLTGSTLAGPVWADYMREIHQGLPYRDFLRPATGLVDVTVCVKSGLLKTPSCTDGEVTLTFLEGTQPELFCEEHDRNRVMETFRHIELNSMFFDTIDFFSDLQMPVLRDDALMREIQEETRRPQMSAASTIQNSSRNNAPSRSTGGETQAVSQTPAASTAPVSNPQTSASNVPVPPSELPSSASNPPAISVSVIENDPLPVSEAAPAAKAQEPIALEMEDELEPPSYNPLLD
jgi:penicillin-binding protein 1A